MYVENCENSEQLHIIIQFNVIEATMVPNSLILGHQKSQYSMSLGVRKSERVQGRQTSERCEWAVRAHKWAVQANGLVTGPVLKPRFWALFNYRAHAQNDENCPFEAKYLHTRLYDVTNSILHDIRFLLQCKRVENQWSHPRALKKGVHTSSSL